MVSPSAEVDKLSISNGPEQILESSKSVIKKISNRLPKGFSVLYFSSKSTIAVWLSQADTKLPNISTAETVLNCVSPNEYEAWVRTLF